MSYKNNHYRQDNMEKSIHNGNQLETELLLRTNPYHQPTVFHPHQHKSNKLPDNRAPVHRDSNNSENHQLIDPRPVRLTPSWEDKNLTSDELNFKNLSLDEVIIDTPPRDRWNFVYFILLLHGIGTLMPWNMFITAKSYFEDYKLVSNDETAKYYRNKFMLFITLASQIPNLIFNFLNVFCQLGGNLTSRIVISILVEIVIFICTVVLAMVDSQDWVIYFFWVTILSVVFLNMANGIYQNSVYGIAGKLPMRYANAVVLGSNISGTIVTIINIISIAIAPNPRTSAIYYFISALFVLLACFDTYFALPLSRFYRYYEHQAEKQNAASYKTGLSPRIPYWTIFSKAFPQLWNVFFTFFITLLIFPSLHSNIKMSDPNFVIPEKFYMAVMCFLVFNVFSVLGNILPFACKISPRWLWLPILFRVLLLPAFLFCNYQPSKDVPRVLPVLICNDWAHFGLGIILGATGGYFASLSMMYAPKTVDPQHSPIAGMLAATALILGIFLGVCGSYLMPVLVENIEFSLPDDFVCNMTSLVK